MIGIVLHSSKTMRRPASVKRPLGVPPLHERAQHLASLYRKLPTAQLAALMHVSDKKAADVKTMFREWNSDPPHQVPAIDAFVGDIYSGLQVQRWSDDDRRYAQRHLYVMSGLYGMLHACDGIMPYRLEMAYRLPDGGSLYDFWQDAPASVLSSDCTALINTSSAEYMKALLPYVKLPVVTPLFKTKHPKTTQYAQVTVHTKIARGAFAGWLVRHKINDVSRLHEFRELNYRYDAAASSQFQPVYICDDFGGIGLSVRLR